jgi:methylase of polypeptide subunit release factors
MGVIKEQLRKINSRLPLALTRVPLGELDGKIDPRDYGFDVIDDPLPSQVAMDVGAGNLYAQIKKRTGTVIPKLERYLNTIDRESAQRLIEKHDRLSYPYRCTFGGANLIIDKGIFNPTLTNASPLLLEAIDFRPEKVLDVFSGSGAFGIVAALHGSEVVTVDTFAKAVDNTVKNAALNDVSGRVDARHGTMKETLEPGESFDLIIANPPLLPGEPEDKISEAIFDPGLAATIDFINLLPQHLADNGRAYLIISSALLRFGHDIDVLCRDNNLFNQKVSFLNVPHETYEVHKITRETFN